MKYTRTPASAAWPFSLLSVKDYMRVTSSSDDLVISALAVTAAAELEAFCEIALLSQTIDARTEDEIGASVDLPVGPFTDTDTLAIWSIAEDGTETEITSGFWVETGLYPRINFTDQPNARLRLTYVAGFGGSASNIPPQLALAISDHVLRMYDRRGDEDMKPGLSPAASRIGARFKRVRV